MHFFNNRGQSLTEGIIICTIITFFMFAALQICIMAVHDMYFNFAAFSAARKVVVSNGKDILKNAKDTVNKLVIPYQTESFGVFFKNTTHWDEDILGKSGKDHSNHKINKHNVKIAYITKIMFYKLFGIYIPLREQSARARMVKSTDSKYYYKAYPDAQEFPKININI